MKLYFLALCIFVINFNNSSKLEIVNTYTIPLDFETGFHADYLQIIFDNDTEYLILGYRDSRKVSIYNFKERSLHKTISLDVEGPNGIGTALGGIYFESLNKFYVMDYWAHKIHEMNGENEIEQSYTIPREHSYPIVELSVMCPIQKIGNQLIMSGNLENHVFVNDYLSMIRLNLNNGKCELFGRGPENTYHHNYMYKHAVNYEFNKTTNSYVISYTVSDSLFILGTDSKLKKKVFAKSKYVDKIPPLRNNRKYQQIGKDEVNEYICLAAYHGIKYDPYNNCYYRFGYKTRTLQEINSYVPPEIFIVVLDESFNTIGEYTLPYQNETFTYSIGMLFIREDGLYIANKNYYNTVSEDELTFDVFRIEKK